MKSVTLYYFSGTGNTRRVSEMLIDQLKSRQIPAEMFSMEDILDILTNTFMK